MIPPFGENGYLPPGVHPATLDEVVTRFGRETEVRRVQAESLRWLVDLARRAGVERLVINGSFVTQTPEPNDVDCALLVPTDMTLDPGLEEEFETGLPFLQIDLLEASDFTFLIERIFASDRDLVLKGVVEVLL
jgi:hypothetical protein